MKRLHAARGTQLCLEQTTFSAFLIENAAGSPYVPAQAEFVVPYHIRSAAGFGGLVAGELFAVILFSKVAISRRTADLLAPLALSVKAAVLPLVRQPIFARH